MKIKDNEKGFKGGGILFTSLHNNKLFFLLGRENKYCDNGAGKWCDFGGGKDDGENSILESVSREASEELVGFLGIKTDLLQSLKNSDKNYHIDNDGYRIFIVPTLYDEKLPCYFNSNQHIIQKYVPENLLKTSKIFEKDMIKYFTINDLKKNRNDLRKFFKISVLKIIAEEKNIKRFIKSKHPHFPCCSFNKTHKISHLHHSQSSSKKKRKNNKTIRK